jgi:sec-independent protein translocase protein TatC
MMENKTGEFLDPEDVAATIDRAEAKQSLLGHLIELRTRFMWCFATIVAATVFCYLYVEEIYGFLVKPLAIAMGNGGTQRLIFTDLTEAFFTYIKVAFCAGFVLSIPIILFHVWRFLAPGLYKNERRVVWPFFVASPLLFIAGASFVYALVMPMAWAFFLGFQSSGDMTTLPIQLEARVSDYLNLVLTLMFAFGICFQLPVVLCLGALMGVVSSELLKRMRRYAIVAIFILAAVLTPPDIISQILLAVPLLAMYEISIFLVKRIEKARNDSSAAL